MDNYQGPGVFDLMEALEQSVLDSAIKRGLKRETRHGYLLERRPDHPLANQGWVLGHRRCLYDHLGPGDQPCHWCGWVLPWQHDNGYRWCINVDHLDTNRHNNRVENLVPSCWCCNVSRSWAEIAPLTWNRLRMVLRNTPPWERQPIPWMAQELERLYELEQPFDPFS